MSEAKHTPGPWALFNDGETSEWIVMPAMRPGDIARVDGENSEANARLIASAPELLAELQNLIECLELAHHHNDLPLPFAGYGQVHLAAARAAIAKAEGATPESRP